MLTEGQSLYLFIVLIYLSECVVWLPGHAFVFVRGLGGWRVLPPDSGLGNERGRFIMTNPLPFAGGMCVATHWPLAFGENGIGAVKRANPGKNRRPPRLFRFLRWADGPFAAMQRALLAAGRPFFTASTHREAAWLARLMEQAAGAPAGKRHAAIEERLRESLEINEFTKRMAVFHSFASWLSMFAVVEFLLLFACAPVAWSQAGTIPFLLTIGLLLAHTIIGAFIFCAAHRRLYPDRKGERIQQTILTALVPTHSMRAVDFLSRGLAGDRHALAVARAIASEVQLKKVAAIILRDLRHSMPLIEEIGDALATADEFHLIESRLIEKTIRDAGLKEEDLLPPPDREGESSLAYCPRCQAQYLAGISTCSDCSDVLLIKFARPASAVG